MVATAVGRDDVATVDERPAARGGSGLVLRVAKWAVALLSIGLVLWLVDWRGSIGLLGRVAIGVAAVAWALDLACVLVSSWKWQRLLAALDVRVGLGMLFRAYWIGAFVSGLLPSTVGGDVTRVALTRRYAGVAPVAASILVERLTGFLVLLAFALAAVLARPDLLQLAGAGGTLQALAALALAGGCGALLLACWAVLRTRGDSGTPRIRAATTAEAGAGAGGRLARAMGKARGFGAKLGAALAGYAGRPGALLAACAASVPFYVLIALFQYAVIRALGVEVDLLDVLAIAPLVTLVAALPAAPNGIGTSEAVFVLLYTGAGLSPEEALAAAVLRRLVLTLTALTGGVLWLAARDRAAAETVPAAAAGTAGAP